MKTKSMLKEAQITDLKIEIKRECATRHIPENGIERLVNYYTGFNEWSEERALKYALKLIKNNTIKELQRTFGGN